MGEGGGFGPDQWFGMLEMGTGGIHSDNFLNHFFGLKRPQNGYFHMKNPNIISAETLYFL